MISLSSLSSWMVREQVGEGRRGSATLATLHALRRFETELADATHVASPAPGASADALSGCRNWSVAQAPPAGAPLDPAEPVVSFYYCKSSPAHPSFPNSLIRYERAGLCPFAPVPPACGDDAAPAARETIVYNDFFHLDATGAVFKRGSPAAGDADPWLELRFTVGRSTPTPNRPMPIYYKFDTKVRTNKAFAQAAD